MNNNCRTCLNRGLCYTNTYCEDYTSIMEEYEDMMIDNYIDEQRQEFYDEWFEYIEQYE